MTVCVCYAESILIVAVVMLWKDLQTYRESLHDCVCVCVCVCRFISCNRSRILMTCHLFSGMSQILLEYIGTPSLTP
jgi:hypothetical protein